MPLELVARSVGWAAVKGMRHLVHHAVEVDELGVVGDRRWCLVDLDRGQVLRTVQHPQLMSVVAREVGDGLGLSLPDGTSADGPARPTHEVVTCDYWGRDVDLVLTDGPHADVVSAWLGRDVRLAQAPRGAVVFGEPLTLLGTASLAALAVEVGRPGLVEESARFRSSMVVETDEPWVEDAWLGREVVVDGVPLRVGGPVPRCVVVDHHPETGERDARLLAALARSRPTTAAGEPVLGVYARAARPGRIRVAR